LEPSQVFVNSIFFLWVQRCHRNWIFSL